MGTANIFSSELTSGQDRICPLFDATVPAGFPSPAADYEQTPLDLNRHLVSNAPATFFVRVSGYSMIGAGIHPDDLLIVDRSLEPKDKSVVIVNLNGETMVKRLRIKNRRVYLEADNEDYPDFIVVQEDELEVWGVVTYVIHAL
ncbi:LexA family protein [Planctomycetota bacterium]